MIKVLHVCPHFLPCTGGIEKVVLDLCMNLKKKEVHSGVLCLNKCAYSSKLLPEKEKINGIDIHRVSFKDLKYYKYAPFDLELLKKFDIIHVHGIGFFADFLAKTKQTHKKPLILSTHGGIFHTKKLGFIKKIYFNLIAKNSLKKFSKVIAISKNDFELFSRIVPEEKLILMENGVEVEKFAKTKPDFKNKNLLFIGRLSKNKRIDNLIKIMRFLPKKQKLFIIGEDWEHIRGELEKLSKQLGIEKQVVFCGRLSEKDLLEKMEKCLFFASASEYEGFGISAIEAMAAGLIPILNNIPSFNSFVENEKNGFIIDFSNIENAQKKINEICKAKNIELKKISEKARKKAMEFAWKNKINEFRKLLEKVMREQNEFD